MTTTEYEVGKYYRVPCVQVVGKKKWHPVMPPWHEDANIIGFPHPHYHNDPRFLDARDYRQFSFLRVFTGWSLFGSVRVGGSLGPIEYRLKKCKRSLPAYPAHVPWKHDLAHAYATKRLTHGICPHKGIDLTTCPVVDGVVTCPGHGLRWHVKTGKLVGGGNYDL